jgi:GTP-binding protein
MKIKAIDANFVASFPTVGGFPDDLTPEIVFAGVSNSGKSSLINSVLKRRELVRVGKTPGKTKLFNLFNVKFRGWLGETEADDEQFELETRLIDCPGSGYAKVAKTERRRWALNLEAYLDERRNIAALVEIADARRLLDEDTKITFPRHRFKLYLVANKVDKLNQSEVSKLNKLADEWRKSGRGEVVLTSALSYEDKGVHRLRTSILELLLGVE